MRRLISIFLIILLTALLAIPALAASEKPEITLQPQSPNYPHYSVAIYTVKATGTNLHAAWYMEWLGKTYPISEIGGAMQDWEPYAGEAYGARQLDDNTFAFIFEGIEYDLDGAYIWCVIEDGHYDVSSQKARVSVGNENTPPTIVDIPTQLTVEQGDEAEIRCIAQAPGNTQLSFLWYETDTGRMEDMRAVDRGTQTSDYLLCDTDFVGTRNYLCMVETSEGGLAYSSIVPVTVTAKAQPPATQPPAPPQTEAPAPATTAPTEAPTVPAPQTQPKETTPVPLSPAPTQPTAQDIPDDTEEGLPWWSLVLIGLGGAGAGVLAAIILIRKK